MFPSEDRGDSPSRPGFGIPWRNPLYEYLVDLYERRVRLVEALAPQRHLAWQTWVTLAIVMLWAADYYPPAPVLKGLPTALMILLVPLALFAGPFLAGWQAQMIAVRNYPSPLDSPHALELLLSTPLTEMEIVAATMLAFVRYPFIGMSLGRLAHLAGNTAAMVAALLLSIHREYFPREMLLMALKIYLPALCVFIYFPILASIDLLLVPSGWLRHRTTEDRPANDGVSGRSGRLPSLAMALALIPVMFRINRMGIGEMASLYWVVGEACPTILVSVTLAILAVTALLPGHLARIRRG